MARIRFTLAVGALVALLAACSDDTTLTDDARPGDDASVTDLDSGDSRQPDRGAMDSAADAPGETRVPDGPADGPCSAAGDAAPVPEVSGLTATPAPSTITLSWQLPAGVEVAAVEVRRGWNTDPVLPEERELLYEGLDSSFVHAQLRNGRIHYYHVFVRDSCGRYSAGLVVTATPSGDPGFAQDGLFLYPGSQEDSFGYALAVDSADRILVGGRYNNYGIVFRLTTDGALDASFSSPRLGGEVRSLFIDQQGKLLVTGQMGSAMALWRLEPDGALDTAFGEGGVRTAQVSAGDIGREVVEDAAGRILVAGHSHTYQASNPLSGKAFVWRFHADGNPDTSFAENGVGTYQADDTNLSIVEGLALQGDAIYLVGHVQPPPLQGTTPWNMVLWKLTAAGALDASFGAAGQVIHPANHQDGTDALIDGSGGLVVAAEAIVTRYSSAGVLDTSFGSGGSTSLFSALTSCRTKLVQDSVGNLLVGGSDGTRGQIVRLTPAGQLDTSFAPESEDLGRYVHRFEDSVVANGLAVDGQGRMVLTGQIVSSGPLSRRLFVLRYAPN